MTEAPAHADDVVAYIIARLGNTGTLKLQKLLYYCQGWHLGFFGTVLFESEIQAWRRGPVVPEIYFKHRRAPSVDTWLDGEPEALTDNQKRLVDSVLNALGALSGFALEDMTHRERPWLDVYRHDGVAFSNHEITPESMQSYFGALVDQSQQPESAV